MEALVTSLNESIDLEEFNYRTFSRTSVFTRLGVLYLKNKYSASTLFYPDYVDVTKKLALTVQAFRQSNKPYLVVPLAIKVNTTQGHANVLFFYKKGAYIYAERYDPGYSCCLEQSQSELDYPLMQLLKNLGVHYVSPDMMSLIVCPQSFVRDDFGYCQTYTLMYIDNLLHNPNRDRLKVIAQFPTRRQLDDYIKMIVSILIRTPGMKQSDRQLILNYDTISAEAKLYVLNLVLSIIS